MFKILSTQDLRCRKQFEFAHSKAATTLNFLRRNFRKAPSDVKELLYDYHVRPILEYACAVLDPQMVTKSDALERVQNRAARFVTNMIMSFTSVSDM